MKRKKALNDTGCRNLADGIILFATKDYMKAVKQLKKNPKYRSAMAVATECEDFFRGNWFKCLTTIDGEWLIARLREEALKDECKRIINCIKCVRNRRISGINNYNKTIKNY